MYKSSLFLLEESKGNRSLIRKGFPVNVELHNLGQTPSFAWPSIIGVCSLLEIKLGQCLLTWLEFKTERWFHLLGKKDWLTLKSPLLIYLGLCFSGRIKLTPWGYCELCHFLCLVNWIILICDSCAEDFSPP